MDPGQATTADGRAPRPVFVSYSTADRKQALAVCKALERRGTKCWISTRDVAPGENYQEAIVRALRGSRAMVLVFSEAANNSDEIKKELSLASRYHIPVMALRIEDVEPSDAFAYELSTRQWIDAFHGWDRSIDALAGRLKSTTESVAQPVTETSHRRRSEAIGRPWVIAVAAAVVLILGAGAWVMFRPVPLAAHSMVVRLTGFQRLSRDLPASLPDTVREEIGAAFGDQGVVGVSTALGPPAGTAPAYALGGTIRRDGEKIRVITRLINERSGATLWSSSNDYEATQLARVPRRIAIQSALMARCGLFGASTYPKSLPDQVLSDYLQYCLTTAVFPTDPGKGLNFARKVVAAAPDFSWGWSAVADAAVQNMYSNPLGPRREELRQIGLQAVDRALALDPRNSFAMSQKALMIDANDRVGQEKLLKRAFAARPLDCGCEHLVYGFLLENAGRYADATSEFRHAIEMLSLDNISEFALADSLSVSGKPEEAKAHYAATVELNPDPMLADTMAAVDATENGNYSAGLKAISNPKLPLADKQRAAVATAYRAMISTEAGQKAQAVKALLSLPDDQKNYLVLRTLAALGANRDALQVFVEGIGSRWDWPSLLWYHSMRHVLDDPAIPGVLQRLGLVKYWRTTHTKPDVCAEKVAPSFCRMI
ncbi:MAG TPA: TIR domain-containing protein [Bradyrhizobium sp.]|uniref:TIR domain-containing protein n=1 Tax=Bradyrhizobium sp. TaxID=376 RepID=UPI002B491132|nr:TIR domain-containing protein [Bradyrhizobium sp.]HKO69965.1 TIR domain-containing protein [Bradyrhizobium sp.]